MLFGSRATGEARADSDYDLVVIWDTPLTPYQRCAEVQRRLLGLGVAVDAIVYTPKEWEEKSARFWGVAHEAATNGRVIHGS